MWSKYRVSPGKAHLIYSMKNFLSIKKIVALFIILQILLFTSSDSLVFAQGTTPTDPTTTGTQVTTTDTQPVDGTESWKPDSDVTFAGKNASRASALLDNIIEFYQWSSFSFGQGTNPFAPVWVSIRNIIYALLSLFILAGAFVLMITRGQSITVKKFIPRFILVIILVTLSFNIISVFYDLTDIVQGFFLQYKGEFIKSKDLLNVSFDYQDFRGFKRSGPDYEESAFISLLLVKLTAATYYVMFIILIVRKVILWFFIIVSPVFPLLLFFAPVRNTAKIWIGEFFRWLLYAPLFAIFLSGLVALWQTSGIPLNNVNQPCQPNDKTIYPTSINILLGGPCQKLAYEPENNLYNNINLPQSFMQYVVALLMLWMVIIMPFILLKIFLDFVNNINFSENNMLKFLMNRPTSPPPAPKSPPAHLSPIAPPPKIPPPMPPKTPGPAGAGLAKDIREAIQMNIMNKQSATTTQSQTQTQSVFQNQSVRDTVSQSQSQAVLKPELTSTPAMQSAVTQILQATKLKVVTIKDVARMEAAVTSKTSVTSEHNTKMNSIREETSRLTESISRISGTSPITTPQEQQHYATLKTSIVTQAESGNPIAKAVVNASLPARQAEIPEENQIQTVKLEDYEEVKKTWTENYKNLEPPQGKDRKEWLKEEITKIPEAIDLLSSQDPQKVNLGKEMVSKILPFLLLGGFSKQEIVAYLKAKQQAANSVLADVEKEDADEDSKVYVDSKKEEAPKSMAVEAALGPDDGPKDKTEGLPVEQTPSPLDKPKS